MSQTAIVEPRAQHGVRDAVLRGQLQTRRNKLAALMPQTPAPAALTNLLAEVDAALERIESGDFGICETCRDNIEHERLLMDPLCRNCLDHLSATEQRALERDLDLAYQVQSGLLPNAGAAIEGWSIAYHYEPHGPVSGDYCDLIVPDAESALIFVGDVTGKGVAASMLMAQLYAIFRSMAAATRSPGDLLARANRIFCEGTLSSFFATVVCGRLNGDGAVEIGNAGHCLPLHVSKNGVAAIPSTGLPMGLFNETEYGVRKIALEKGDSLVLYSDGLTESFNGGGEQYGTQRLSRFLGEMGGRPPRELLAAALADLRQFRSGAPKSDDLTIMIVRREP